MRRRGTIGICAVLLTVTTLGACESATAPSVQSGFDDRGSGNLGQPRLVLSQHIAVGQTVDPIVELAAAFPDSVARTVARFRSSNGKVITVNPDGTLTAQGRGTSVVTVNVDGNYDKVDVDVTAGWQPSFYPTTRPVEIKAVNNDGVTAVREDSLGFVIQGGIETSLGACIPTAINIKGQVACNLLDQYPCPDQPDAGSGPALYAGGVVNRLAGGEHGWIGGVNDSTVAFLILGDCSTQSYKYYLALAGGGPGVPLPGVSFLDEPAVVALNNANVGLLNLTDVDGRKAFAVTMHGTIELERTSTTAGALEPTASSATAADINDVNDIVGSSNGPRAWYGSDMPAPGSGANWPSHRIGDGRCEPIAITDKNQIFGRIVAGVPCEYETGGVFDIPSQTIAPDAAAGWTIDWFNFAVSRNGILVVPATSSAGQPGVAIIKTS